MMEKIKKNYILFIGLIILVCVFLIWLSTIYFLKADKERGTFGDMFGAVNALFSGMAFTGIIITILLQREELSLQRIELQDTRKELERSANAQERSEKALINQQNQTTFFNLLEQQKKLIETIRIGDNIGFPAIREFSNEIRKKLTTYKRMEEAKHFSLFADTANHPSALIHSHKAHIITYLKNLETIIKFIESHLSNEGLFHSILNSYISVPEKYLLGVCYHFCGNKLETKFLKESFNYIEHFEALLYGIKYDATKYFPHLYLKKTYFKNFYDEMFEDKSFLVFGIITPFNLFEENAQLLEIELSVTSVQFQDGFDKWEVIKDEMKFEEKESETLVRIDEVFKRILPELPNGEFEFNYTFIFKYYDRVYKISDKHLLDKLDDFIPDEDDYIVSTRYIFSFPEK